MNKELEVMTQSISDLESQLEQAHADKESMDWQLSHTESDLLTTQERNNQLNEEWDRVLSQLKDVKDEIHSLWEQAEKEQATNEANTDKVKKTAEAEKTEMIKVVESVTAQVKR